MVFVNDSPHGRDDQRETQAHDYKEEMKGRLGKFSLEGLK